jgi:DNA repair protein RadD
MTIVYPISEFKPQAINLRQYQRETVNAAVPALKAGKAALLVLPTGSGKSLIAADVVRRAHLASMRSLVIAPSQELVQQDADAVGLITARSVVPSIACAGLGMIDLTGSVVIGTPQTVARRLDQLGHIDFLAVDEAHRLGRRSSGQLRTIVETLRARNPKLMLLGLTATPFRTDTGLLIEGDDAIFQTVAYEVLYHDLVAAGFLAPLVGPQTAIERLGVAGLRIVNGDYSAADLTRFDDVALNERIVDQIVQHGADRRSWLVFAVGVRHAKNLAKALRQRDIDARILTGQTQKQERADLVTEFKAGRIRCLVGVDVFSVGFDARAVDLIAVVRPTCSPVWHVQSAGRGTRIAPDKRDCLILDFAGNFARLGPIDAPHIRARGERHRTDSDTPLSRNCPNCRAIVASTAITCPICNTSLISNSRPTTALSIQAASHEIVTGTEIFPVLGMTYVVHRKAGRPDSLRINYKIAGYQFTQVSEWMVSWFHSPGSAKGKLAREKWLSRLRPGAPRVVPPDAETAAVIAPRWLRSPSHVRLRRDGTFTQVFPIFAEAEVAA